MSKITTREELFKQVWERPMTKVAADYGISDVALKKICTKHRISVPARGYWAKLAAGKPVQRGHYRAVDEDAINRIQIYGSGLQCLPDDVKAARETARAYERQPENKVVVTDRPDEMLPSVARTMKKLERAKTSDHGLVIVKDENCFHVKVSPASINRVAAFLNAIVAAASERAHKITSFQTGLVFIVNDEIVTFGITEEIMWSKHVPKQDELDKLEKWERKQKVNRDPWSFSWRYDRPDPPEWDYSSSGKLKDTIDATRWIRDGLQKSFGDGKTQTIESQINRVLEGLATWSAAIKARRV